MHCVYVMSVIYVYILTIICLTTIILNTHNYTILFSDVRIILSVYICSVNPAQSYLTCIV